MEITEILNEYINSAHCPQVQHSHDTIMTSCFKFH